MRAISSVLETLEFTCNLCAMDTALKTEGREHPSAQVVKVFGMDRVLLLGLRWHLPITVTCSWIFTSAFCLFEVPFTRTCTCSELILLFSPVQSPNPAT